MCLSFAVCQSHTKYLLKQLFPFFFIGFIIFLHLSPFSPSQLLPPQNASVSSAVKVKTSSSPQPCPPRPLPPVPPSLSPEDCGSGLPQTAQLTASLTSQCQPTGDSKILLFIIVFIQTYLHHHRRHCHLCVRLLNDTHTCDANNFTNAHFTHAFTLWTLKQAPVAHSWSRYTQTGACCSCEPASITSK